jgi:hypothetical protein
MFQRIRWVLKYGFWVLAAVIVYQAGANSSRRSVPATSEDARMAVFKGSESAAVPASESAVPIGKPSRNPADFHVSKPLTGQALQDSAVLPSVPGAESRSMSAADFLKQRAAKFAASESRDGAGTESSLVLAPPVPSVTPVSHSRVIESTYQPGSASLPSARSVYDREDGRSGTLESSLPAASAQGSRPMAARASETLEPLEPLPARTAKVKVDCGCGK